ncbi:MAG: tetratricopeptide repeat protein [Verrucomicrobiota bacterium]|nr:tetratricopeptide repeat protein [Verrucomicrobiota bacterium]
MIQTALEYPNQFHLSAASGWVDLGNFKEAARELARVDGRFWNHPDVLEMRWVLHTANGHWEQSINIATQMVLAAPERPEGWIHRAYSLRRAPQGGLEAAWDSLHPALKAFPEEPTIHYNLSCYACQMNRMDEARILLKSALKVGNKNIIKQKALQDSDLEPLWQEIVSY